MITRRELEEAIADTENYPKNYQTCQKLATFYTLLDHMDEQTDSRGMTQQHETITENVIGAYGDTEFLNIIAGKDSSEVWNIIDELMSTLEVLNPRLFNSVLIKLKK